VTDFPIECLKCPMRGIARLNPGGKILYTPAGWKLETRRNGIVWICPACLNDNRDPRDFVPGRRRES